MTAIERALTNGKPAGSVGTAVGVAEAASTSLVAGAASAELPHWPAQGRGAWPAYSEPATQPAASAKATSASAMPTVPTPPRVARVAWCIAASIAVGIGHGKPLDQDRDQISMPVRRLEAGTTCLSASRFAPGRGQARSRREEPRSPLTIALTARFGASHTEPRRRSALMRTASAGKGQTRNDESCLDPRRTETATYRGRPRLRAPLSACESRRFPLPGAREKT